MRRIAFPVFALAAGWLIFASGNAMCASDAIDLTPQIETDSSHATKVDTLLDEYEMIGDTFEAALKTTSNQTVMLDAYNDFTGSVQEWTARWKQEAPQVPIEDMVRVKIRLDSLNARMKELISKGVPSAGAK